jgi:hypothetical protein
MFTQITPRRMTQSELAERGFIPQPNGTYLHPTNRQQRVACRKCAKWVTQTTASRRDVPNGYCPTCARQHRSQDQ